MLGEPRLATIGFTVNGPEVVLNGREWTRMDRPVELAHAVTHDCAQSRARCKTDHATALRFIGYRRAASKSGGLRIQPWMRRPSKRVYQTSSGSLCAICLNRSSLT